MMIYLSRAVQVATFKQYKASTKVSTKYSNFVDVFVFNLAIELLENTGINEHAIELVDAQQPGYLQPVASVTRDFKDLHQDLFENRVYPTF